MTGRIAKRLRRLEEALLPVDKTLLSIPLRWIDTETGKTVAELPPAPVEKVDYRRGLVYEASSL